MTATPTGSVFSRRRAPAARPLPPGQTALPGQPALPGQSSFPGRPQPPGHPLRPGEPAWPPGPHSLGPDPREPYPPAGPARVWLDPGDRPSLTERLLARRIVMAPGHLDGEAATRLCAQLLALDAEGDDPIRLELQGMTAELTAALTVMGVLDVVGVPVRARAGGRVSGPALGVLAACDDRRGYPNAVFVLSEPRADFDGSAAELASHEQELAAMLDVLYFRLAEVTGREVDEIRDDFRRARLLSTDQAVSYGLLHGSAASGGATAAAG